MSEFDISSETTQDTFEIDKKKAEKMSDVDKLKTAMMRSSNQQTDIKTEYINIESTLDKGVPGKALMEQEQLEFMSKRSAEIDQYFTDNVSNPDPEVRESLLSIIDGKQDMMDMYSDQVDGVDKVFADQYKDETLDDFRERQVIAESSVHRMVDDMVDEQGFGAATVDFVSEIFGFDDTKDENDLAKLLGMSHEEWVGSLSTFQTMDPTDQVEYMEEIMPLMMEALDNNEYAVRSLVSTYFSDDIDHDLFMRRAFDTVGVAFLPFDLLALAKGVPAAVKAINRTVASRQASRQVRDLDNVELAGTLDAAAASDETGDVARALGKDEGDVAASAHPAKLEDQPIISGQMDGVAGAVQRARKNLVTRLMEDAIPTSGSRIGAGQARKWSAVREKTVERINKLEEKLLTASPIQTLRIKREIARHTQELERISNTQGTLKANNTASAQISLLQQGIIPAKFRKQFQEIVEQEIQKLSKPTPPLENVTRDQAVDALSTPRLLDNPEEFGLSPEFVEGLKAIVRAPLRQLKNEADELALSPLTPDELAVAHRRAEELVKRSVQNAGKNVESLEIVGRGATGFDVKYVTDDGLQSTYTHNFTRDEAGVLVSDPKLVKSNVLTALRGVFSPEVVWKDLLGNFVNDVTFGGQQADRIVGRLMKKWSSLEDGLSKESKQYVDSLLQVGDEENIVFKVSELRDGSWTTEMAIGNQGIANRKFTDKEIRAYYSKRAFYDEVHSFRDAITRSKLEFDNYKDLKFIDKEGKSQHMILRQLPPGVTPRGKVFFPDKGSFLTVRTAEDYKEFGYEVAEMLQGVRIGETNKFTKFTLVKTDDIKALPKRVLNYEAGYVPRIYQPGYHFVKENGSNNTLYAFEKKLDADDYARQINEEGGDVTVKLDNEQTDAERLINGAESYGALYTSPRKTTPLMVKGEDGVFKPTRLSTAQATQRYLQSVASAMPLTTYRMNMQQKWVNTANMVAKAQNREPIKHFDDALNLGSDEASALNDSRDYLRRVLSIDSRQETATARHMQKIGEAMRGKPGGDWVLNNIHGDPIKAMKSLTFNAHLGWFSVRQLFIQAQNAALAISIHPKLAPKAMYETLAMRAGWHSDDVRVWETIAKNAGMDADDFVNNMRMFKQSGLKEGIARHADFDSNLDGLGVGTFETLRKAAKAGRGFYEEGETISRLMAWNIARRSMIDAGKEVTVKSLNEETLRLHMNLQAQNAATFQTNALAIPTQFLQVFTKFAENLLPAAIGGTGKWTTREKLQVMFGQLALYGTIGVPVAQEAMAYAAELRGQTPEEFAKENPTFTEGIEEGLVGAISSVLGFDNNFSEGASLLAGLSDNVVVDLAKAFLDFTENGGDINLFETSLGASLNTVKRGSDALTQVFDSFQNVFLSPSPATIGGEFLNVLDQTAAITSTWSSARKVFYINHYGVGLRSNRGHLMMTGEELGIDDSWQTRLAKGFGFATDTEVDWRRAMEYDMNSRQAIRETEDALREAYLAFLKSGNWELFRKQKGLILGGHNNPLLRSEIEMRFNRNMLKEESSLDRTSQSSALQLLKDGGRVPSFTKTTERDD